jgi:hypothetical protein
MRETERTKYHGNISLHRYQLNKNGLPIPIGSEIYYSFLIDEACLFETARIITFIDKKTNEMMLFHYLKKIKLHKARIRDERNVI